MSADVMPSYAVILLGLIVLVGAGLVAAVAVVVGLNLGGRDSDGKPSKGD